MVREQRHPARQMKRGCDPCGEVEEEEADDQAGPHENRPPDDQVDGLVDHHRRDPLAQRDPAADQVGPGEVPPMFTEGSRVLRESAISFTRKNVPRRDGVADPSLDQLPGPGLQAASRGGRGQDSQEAGPEAGEVLGDGREADGPHEMEEEVEAEEVEGDLDGLPDPPPRLERPPEGSATAAGGHPWCRSALARAASSSTSSQNAFADVHRPRGPPAASSRIPPESEQSPDRALSSMAAKSP